MASMGGKGDTLALWLPKEMGSEKAFPKGEALGFCLLLCEQKETRRKAKPCPGKRGRLFLPFLLAHTKEMVFGDCIFKDAVLERGQRRSLWIIGQGRQPLDRRNEGCMISSWQGAALRG